MSVIRPRKISVTAQAKRELDQVQGEARKNSYVTDDRIRSFLMGQGTDSKDGKSYAQVVTNGFFNTPGNPMEFICVIPVLKSKDETKNVGLKDYGEDSKELLGDIIEIIERTFWDPVMDKIFVSVVNGLKHDFPADETKEFRDKILEMIPLKFPNPDHTDLFNNIVRAIKTSELWLCPHKGPEFIEQRQTLLKGMIASIETSIKHPELSVEPEESKEPELIQTASFHNVDEDGKETFIKAESDL